MHARLIYEPKPLRLDHGCVCSGWPCPKRGTEPVVFEELFAPPDLSEMARLLGVNCGPAAYAALAGRNILDVIDLFPQYPERPWTSRSQMKNAFRSSSLSWEEVHNTFPENGVCLVQFNGPWSNYSYRLAQLRHSHWIAVKNGFVYDVNWEGWLPMQNWEEVVLDELMRTRKRCDGWGVLASYEVKCSRSNHLFPSCASTPTQRFRPPYAAASLKCLASFESTR
jgi:hypothetical protein